MSDATDRTTALATLLQYVQAYTAPALATKGSYQSIVAIVLGAITNTGAGNARVTITALGLTGSPKAFDIAVANNDSDYTVAGKIRVALAIDNTVNTLFDVSGVGASVALTSKTQQTNDATLNISIANGTCTGLTAAPTSAQTCAGAAPDTSEVESVLDRNKRASTWLVNTAYSVNDVVMPPIRNDHSYIALTPGTSQLTDPGYYFWPKGQGGKAQDGTSDPILTWLENGPDFSNVYNIRQAAYECWDLKCGKASQFIADGDLHFEQVYDHCVKQRDSFAPLI